MRQLLDHEMYSVGGGIDPTSMAWAAILLSPLWLNPLHTATSTLAGAIVGPYAFAAPVNTSAPIPEIVVNVTANIRNAPLNAALGAFGGLVGAYLF